MEYVLTSVSTEDPYTTESMCLTMLCSQVRLKSKENCMKMDQCKSDLLSKKTSSHKDLVFKSKPPTREQEDTLSKL